MVLSKDLKDFDKFYLHLQTSLWEKDSRDVNNNSKFLLPSVFILSNGTLFYIDLRMISSVLK